MRIETEMRPQRIKVYIADDGKKFDSQKKCLRYESDIKAELYKNKVKDSDVFRNRIEDFRDFMDERPGTLFRICNEEDHDIIIYGLMHGEEILCDDYDGPGWYILLCEDGGDGPDTYSLWNYEDYRESLLNGIQYHIERTDRCIADMEIELFCRNMHGEDDE